MHPTGGVFEESFTPKGIKREGDAKSSSIKNNQTENITGLISGRERNTKQQEGDYPENRRANKRRRRNEDRKMRICRAKDCTKKNNRLTKVGKLIVVKNM